MPTQIKAFDNANQAIVTADGPVLQRTYFNLLRLAPGESETLEVPGFECLCVVQSGTVDITVNDETFTGVGQRSSIWEGNADSVYVGTGSAFTVTATSDAEIAVAGGLCQGEFAPFRVTPAEVDEVDVGSTETHSRRRIRHIIGADDAHRSGMLLVSELYADDGCWSGYPPHKHDETRTGETAHEELYHYRFDPETGFGGQFCYFDDGPCEVYRTQHGDSVLLEGGYHPTVTSPGHREYIFTILVGREQKALEQHFHEDQSQLVNAIPGISAMREKFRK